MGERRREQGAGTVYQRSDGLWVGRATVGYHDTGRPKRVTASAKTKAACSRKLQEKVQARLAGAPTGAAARKTVMSWADDWIALKEAGYRPKGLAGARTARRWIVTHIGNRKLAELTLADVRAVEQAQRDAGNAGSSAVTTHRWLMAMLNDAIQEGYSVPEAVLKAPRPRSKATDRTCIPDAHVEAILREAAKVSDTVGLRWLVGLLYGWRQSEVLGLRESSLDLDGGLAWLQWQLQALPYKVPRDKRSGFRVPVDMESVHLVDSWHLMEPKSMAGQRWAPIPPVLVEPLRQQARAVRAIEGGHGLLFAHPDGRPVNPKQDRAQWHALQEAAGVSHPSGRPWHVHECRNTAASRMRNAGGDEMAQQQLMGHADIKTTQGYQTVSDVGQAVVVGEMVKGLPVPGVEAKPGRRAAGKLRIAKPRA